MHNKVKELFFWYIAGTLSEKEKVFVEDHLKGCASCQEALKETEYLAHAVSAESIRKKSDAPPSDHINARKLMIYAEDVKKLDPEDRKAIESHLSKCDPCREQIMILKEMDALSGEGASAGRQSGFGPTDILKNWISAMKTAFPRFFLRPAFAYLIVLALLYPAWLGLRSDKRPPMIRQILYLEEIRRNEIQEKKNQFPVHPDTDDLILAFSIPITTDKTVQYDLELYDESDQRIWKKKDIQSQDQFGSFEIHIKKNRLSDQEYTLIAKETNRETGEIHKSYPRYFKLIEKNSLD